MLKLFTVGEAEGALQGVNASVGPGDLQRELSAFPEYCLSIKRVGAADEMTILLDTVYRSFHFKCILGTGYAWGFTQF